MAIRAEIRDLVVSRDELQEILGISSTTVHRLTLSGVLRKDGRGEYPLFPNVMGYVSYLSEHANSAKAKSESRVKAARAREIELRNARAENRLIEFDEAVGFVHDIFGPLRSDLLGVPARCSRDIALRQKIETEINACLSKAADRTVTEAAALQAHGAGTEAQSDDDAGRMGGGEQDIPA